MLQTIDIPDIGHVDNLRDLVGIISPHESPLLNILNIQCPVGFVSHSKYSWMENHLVHREAVIQGFDSSAGKYFCVERGEEIFLTNDILIMENSRELMLVTGVEREKVFVQRASYNTEQDNFSQHRIVKILGNLKKKDRFQYETQGVNYTCVLHEEVIANESDNVCLIDELEYQKQEKLRTLLKDIENMVIRGGDSTNKKRMKGILDFIQTNKYKVNGTDMSRDFLNKILADIWSHGGPGVDTIVASGIQKRKMNNITESSANKYCSGYNIFKSTTGDCRVICSRYLHPGTVLLLNSSSLSILPRKDKELQFKTLSKSEKTVQGKITGEYTLKMSNEEYSGIIEGLSC